MSRSPLHRPSHAVRLGPIALALLLPLVPVLRSSAASAQEPLGARGHPPLPDSEMNRPHSLSRLSGPPGTEVTIQMEQLPAITPLWLGIGATRSGFEALQMVITDTKGQFSQAVSIPASAGSDRAYVFIVFDAYFNRLALTRPFDVTGLDGTVQRRGQIGARVGGCVSLKADDGVIYALAGQLPAIAAEEQVIVEGLPLESAEDCQAARGIRVTRLYGLVR